MSSRPAQRFVACVALAVCLVCLAPTRCAAWGSAGHHVIARIAAGRLSDSAKKEVARLLGVPPDDKAIAEAMAQASTYADEIRLLRPDTARWHFVDMPGSASAYVAARDCAETKQGDCAVAAVERFEKVLADANARPEEKAEALKFLIHLVGDLSQPLHCYGDDEGGNLVRVTFFMKQTNLHWVWDIGLIERAEQSVAVTTKSKPDEAAVVTFLTSALAALESKDPKTAASLWLTPSEAKAPAEALALWAGGTPQQWAVDSHAVALSTAYHYLPGYEALAPNSNKAAQSTKSKVMSQTNAPSYPQQNAAPDFLRPAYVLDKRYYDSCAKDVGRQLMKTGLRLAAVLNVIFK